ncbi:AMP-binding protein [Burkholderiaceae bacterium FT117]|uniref:AMP-binding protein n=1 Tax=Zeimonas sediminis TaxID=2944268 RepID=UPI002342D7CD|nr:AMP-binding protein [Zeimonas sediminis]MCM5571305.1 AMP-binding protein [Zeimonas sediminis]
MNLAHWLARSAAVFGDRPALAHGETVVCGYREFAGRAARGARWLLDAGLAPGDRVGIFRGNDPDYLVWLWSIWWAGLAAVPINAKLHGREAAYILSHSGAKLCLVDAERGAALSGHAPEGCELVGGGALSGTGGSGVGVPAAGGLPDVSSLEPAPIADRGEEDEAWLFYTSGTTGRPKGVQLTARNLRWCTMAYLAEVQSVSPGDTMLHPAPLSHGGGLYHLPYVVNGGLNVVPASGGFDGAEIAALAGHWRNASFFAAPTMVHRLVEWAAARLREGAGTGTGTGEQGAEGRRPIEGLATICYGGGPMYLADIERALEVIGPHFAQIYGQGESPMTITVLPKHVILDREHPRHRERLASVGYPQPMVEVSVRGEDGRELPPGEPGEVCVRGEVVMKGYLDDPKATAAAIRDGWLHTGDVGALDADGFLTLLDRSKDLIISGGTNIYPREVEEALLTHPAVAEVSVVGAPDPDWGEIVVAWVVLREPATEAELDAHCLDRIARFKRPKRWRFAESLPKNNYGKVLKTELRERERAQAAGDGTGGDRTKEGA